MEILQGGNNPEMFCISRTEHVRMATARTKHRHASGFQRLIRWRCTVLCAPLLQRDPGFSVCTLFVRRKELIEKAACGWRRGCCQQKKKKRNSFWDTHSLFGGSSSHRDRTLALWMVRVVTRASLMWGGGGRKKLGQWCRRLCAAANLYLVNQIHEISCDTAFLPLLSL